MKKVLTFIIALVGSATMSLAQDIITLKNGEEVKALVQEVGATEIKYKKFENATGPTYVLQKAEIFMIKYANGERDVFTTPVTTPPANGGNVSTTPVATSPNANVKQEIGVPRLTSRGGNVYDAKTNALLSKFEVRDLMGPYPSALTIYDKAKVQATCSLVMSYVGGGLVGWGLGSMLGGAPSDGDYVCLAIGAGVVGGAFILVGVATKNVNRSVQLYNDSLPGRPTAFTHDLRFGFTSSGGVGFTLTF
jgi:hypothetical protein